MVYDPFWARAQCSAPSGPSAHMQRPGCGECQREGRERRGGEGLKRGKRQRGDGNGGKETVTVQGSPFGG